ncbi:MAG: glutaredoxin [Deltaproteobacteria bacterium]|nr:glutaredoxin [Deltaproteobacteria bacterium]
MASDEIKDRAYRALTSKTGNRLFPVRWAKGALLALNSLAGQPLLEKDELVARRERDAMERERAKEIGKGLGTVGAAAVGLAAAKAAQAKQDADVAAAGVKVKDAKDAKDAKDVATAAVSAAASAAAGREAAPVMLYMDWNSRHDLKRITEVLISAGIKWQELDVTEDESTRAWVKANGGVEDLPVLFVAGEAIGGYQEVAQADVTGELGRKVFGA